jgi:hypothetical protein
LGGDGFINKNNPVREFDKKLIKNDVPSLSHQLFNREHICKEY